MTRTSHTCTLRSVAIIMTVIAFTVILFAPNAFATLSGLTWGISKSECVQKFSYTDADIRAFSPSDDSRYENRIMNYIVAIDSDLKSDITIFRTVKSPIRDLLFVKNRLYSILEDYGTVSAAVERRTLESLKKSYGEPSIQRDKQVVIYSFQDANTKVIMISTQKGSGYDCKVYYYAARLFKMLMTK